MNLMHHITCVTLLRNMLRQTQHWGYIPLRGYPVLRGAFSMKKLGIGIALVTLLFNANQVLAFSDDEDPVMTREQRFELAFDASVWPEYYHNTLLRLSRCESSLRANAVGDHGESIGLLQINTRWNPRIAENFNLYDPIENLNAGYIVFLERHRTFDAWSCAR